MKIFPVKKDKYVWILKKSSFHQLIKIYLFRPIMIDRFKTKLDNLIGQPSGYQYEIKNQQLFMKNDLVKDNDAVQIKNDNRNLVDTPANQKLSREEIEDLKTNMKNDDMTGAELVDKLIENSASFSSKTEYSQEKYIKKKKEK